MQTDIQSKRRESRCGLWAKTAESPCLFSLLENIVNPELFPLVPRTERLSWWKADRGSKGDRDGGKHTEGGWDKQKSESNEGRFPNLLPLASLILPCVLPSPWKTPQDTVSFSPTSMAPLHKVYVKRTHAHSHRLTLWTVWFQTFTQSLCSFIFGFPLWSHRQKKSHHSSKVGIWEERELESKRAVRCTENQRNYYYGVLHHHTCVGAVDLY